MEGLVPSSRVIVGEWAAGLAAPSSTTLFWESELTAVVSMVIVGLHMSGQPEALDLLVVFEAILTLGAYQGPFCGKERIRRTSIHAVKKMRNGMALGNKSLPRTSSTGPGRRCK